ncbi:life-span regulatory factor-domain-containing protein [Boeremia exigua]|uniref:life-span regulatory factor-domain-containing protein n=1 Tax=Boeremia exigua TaxID=749465 RepID=UPI001E8E8147|nr:life-span regulatory factor-domain-containing protein [Boeremia exigua]KAH6625696.1 life-span regulatory factor-domain-containing protein [Boeremia exigua]
MATHHVRHPSHHSKKAHPNHPRPSKPAPLSKRSASHGRKAQSHTAQHREVVEDEDEDPMAVSFLNYCTVCEKQIIVPSNSVLYCSESCKKKDAEKSLTYYDYSPPTTPFSNFTFDDLHFHDIIPQRSPTQSHSKRNSYASSEGSIDEDYHRSDSDASNYLRQFQNIANGTDTVRPVRPRYERASTSSANFSAAPSLSHTPTSSYSFSLPYTPYTQASNNRPLPPRTHGSSYASKSIDLVTPMTGPSSPKQYWHKAPPVSRTSMSTIEGEIMYAKSPVPSLSPANGSLGLLLGTTPRQ